MADTTTHLITAIRYANAHPELSDEFKKAFYLGSQGPDVFFFGMDGASFAFADSLHDVAPKAMFEKDGHDIDNETETYKGYYYGILLHYFLDRIVHQYVGYRRRTFPEPYSHTLTETAMDMVICEREFGCLPEKFPYDDYFKTDDELAKEVYRFYKARRTDEMLTEEYVKKCMANFLKFTKKFMRPDLSIKLMVMMIEKKKKAKGSFSCHLKTRDHYNLAVMNDERKPWQGRDEVFTLSAEDMLDKALTDFEAEIKKIKSEQPYVFVHTEEFSCNK